VLDAHVFVAMDLTGHVRPQPGLAGNPPCSGRAQAAIAKAITEAKKGSTTIYLNSSDVADAGVLLLLQGLAECPDVKNINLGRNGITNSGAIKIADALPKLQRLEILTLAQNGIGDDGAVRLAEALEAHPRLHLLSLEGNSIGDLGASALVTALTSCERRGVSCTMAMNPVRRLVGPALETLEPAAGTVKALSRVGVTLGQLLPLFKDACDKNLIDPWKTTTGEAIRDIVLPGTCRQGTSFVEANKCKNEAPQVHVIHAWTALFQDLLKIIAIHASGKAEPSLDPSDDLWRYDPEFLEKPYFIDAFCCNQHSSTNRLRGFGLADTAAFPVGDARCQIDKLDLVAEQIRRRGGRVLVAADSKNRLLGRLACLREIHQAITNGMPMEATFIAIQEAHGALAENAEACSEKARLEMLEAIVAGGGYAAFDRDIQDFINGQVAIKWKEKVEGKRR